MKQTKNLLTQTQQHMVSILSTWEVEAEIECLLHSELDASMGSVKHYHE